METPFLLSEQLKEFQMINGIIRDPQVGEKFKVLLSNGNMRVYQYKGFGDHMSQRWLDVENGKEVINIPPYTAHEKL